MEKTLIITFKKYLSEKNFCNRRFNNLQHIPVFILRWKIQRKRKRIIKDKMKNNILQ
jgi:hypothetical protein